MNSIISSFVSYIFRAPTFRTLTYIPIVPFILFDLIRDQTRHEAIGSRIFHESAYDYVIVGAGTAGAVIASRISEDYNKTVLLLECGGTENIFSDIPLLDLNLQMSSIDWSYKTEPQRKACLGMKDRVSHWPRGKVMGGSSTLNTMIFSRANPRDYDRWQSQGANGWSFDNLFPYFIKSEDNTDEDLVATGYHGIKGPLTVSSPAEPHMIAKIFRDSGPEVGYSVGDINGEKQSVFSILQRTIRSGRRCSTSKAYLEPLAQRKNLHILTNSCVKRILFDDNKRAIGVSFDGMFTNDNVVNARQEVILSAGAINSPQLLMLSGIGPKEHLKSMGIKVISDLPVGDNLQDHYGSSIFFTMEEDIGLNLRRDTSPENILDYLYLRNNSLSNPVTEGTAFIKTKFANQSDDWPDVQLYLNAGSVVTDSGYRLKTLIGIKDEVFSQVFEPYVGQNTFTITAIVLRPQSRGYIRLKSTDPYIHPIIEANYFEEIQDLNILAEGLKFALKLTSSPKFQMIRAKPFQTKFPDCQSLELYSDQYIKCMSQSYTITSYHPSGTCKMGDISDKTTVVDSQLRVKGVKGLRVIDASIMPSIISGNLNAPVVAIAEKMADHIRGRRIKPFLPPINAKNIKKLLVQRLESIE